MTESNFKSEEVSTLQILIMTRLLSNITYYLSDEQDILSLFALLKKNITSLIEGEIKFDDMAHFDHQIKLYISLASNLEPSDKTEETSDFQVKLLNFLL